MRNNDCNPIAQKIVPVYDNSAKELFKYSTKIVTESNKGLNIYVSALDTIFNAMKGMRTFQAFGNVKKVSEDIEELNSELYEDIEQYDFVLWKWNNNDWFNMLYGNSLSGYTPTQSMLELTTTRMII
jgi:mannose-6-phosphate isomerase class I